MRPNYFSFVKNTPNKKKFNLSIYYPIYRVQILGNGGLSRLRFYLKLIFMHNNIEVDFDTPYRILLSKNCTVGRFFLADQWVDLKLIVEN